MAGSKATSNLVDWETVKISFTCPLCRENHTWNGEEGSGLPPRIESSIRNEVDGMCSYISAYVALQIQCPNCEENKNWVTLPLLDY